MIVGLGFRRAEMTVALGSFCRLVAKPVVNALGVDAKLNPNRTNFYPLLVQAKSLSAQVVWITARPRLRGVPTSAKPALVALVAAMLSCLDLLGGAAAMGASDHKRSFPVCPVTWAISHLL